MARTGSSRSAFPPDWWARGAWLLLLVYLLYAASHLELTPARFAAGLEHGAKFLARLFPPDFKRWELLVKGMVESLQIAIVASALGSLLSLPLALVAARNLMPAWASWPARAVMVVCRSFHPVIVAILFVKAVGFGALAGVLALIVASLGFISKLMAEAVEEMSMQQVEAVRATGAPFGSSASSARAASVARCSPRSSASTTTSSAPSFSPSSRSSWPARC